MTTPLAVIRRFLLALAAVACIAPAHAALLIVDKSGGGEGTVSSNLGGINCGPTCSAEFGPNTVVTLTATPSVGSVFSGWGFGSCASFVSGPCTFLVFAGTTTVTAIFRPALTVVRSGDGTGSVSSIPSGDINCGTRCSAGFTNGSTVDLVATAAPGSTFSGWSGACSGTSPNCSVQVSIGTTVTASFALIPTLASSLGTSGLSWTSTGSGAPWAPQSQVFLEGGSAARSGTTGNSGVSRLFTTVTGPISLSFSWKVSSEASFDFLTLFVNDVAQPGRISGEVDWTPQVVNLPAGNNTLEWRYSKDGSGSAGQDAAWLDNVVLSSYRLFVGKSGLGSGLVTSSPAGINCVGICSVTSATFSNGTQVTLTAAASPGSVFNGWSGGVCSGSSPTCTVSMTAPRTVTADFLLDPGPAVDNTALSWTSSGNALWAPQSQVFFTGGSAARSGAIRAGEVSTLSTTVTGPGILSFRWKVSSFSSVFAGDVLDFRINGTSAVPSPISGEVDWNYRVFNIPAGTHVLEWRYSKAPSSLGAGQDAGWVDAVSFSRNPRDFSADGGSDLLWQNTSTGDRFVWFMNGAVFSGATSLGVVSTDWSMAGSADFNGDGQADILWQNTVTGDRFIWFMNGASYLGGVSLGAVPTDWSIAGTGDFNGDGKPDILWQNTVTGARLLWFMNGATYTGAANLGTVPTEWSIAGTGDYNTDGRPDILWQNTATGERVLWFMNGATYTGAASLGVVPTEWSIVGTGDFNGDARPDIVWQNNATGDRYVWFMDGTAFTGAAFLGSVPPVWSLVP